MTSTASSPGIPGNSQQATPAQAALVAEFLLTVRTGLDVDRAPEFLAEHVLAHQLSQGADQGRSIRRTPHEYAEHVRQMHQALGPWTFEITGLAVQGTRVAASWRQLSPGTQARRPVVQRGHAEYAVRDGRIVEYWIDVDQQPAPRSTDWR